MKLRHSVGTSKPFRIKVVGFHANAIHSHLTRVLEAKVVQMSTLITLC
jgi:hypothetical protein